MEKGPSAGVESPREWYKRARIEWDPVFFKERRFKSPWADVELLASVQRARDWLESNPVPDEQLAQHICSMLDAYSQLPTATVSRLGEWREVIDHHATAILDWEATLGDSPLGGKDPPDAPTHGGSG
jgi:hypothetical protein